MIRQGFREPSEDVLDTNIQNVVPTRYSSKFEKTKLSFVSQVVRENSVV